MNIGILFPDQGFSNRDLAFPELGNNGVGGTPYCFLMLGRFLKLYNPDDRIIFYHYNTNTLPDGVESKIVCDFTNLAEDVKSDEVDVFVFRADKIYNDLLNLLEKKKIKSVAWAHNYIDEALLKFYLNSHSVKRIVFVGREMYDRYIDHDAIQKCTFIYNMFDADKAGGNRDAALAHIVTYTGSLVRPKGFHLLAAAWRDVINAVPDAELYVIGNGAVYDEKAQLGSFGIAEKKYEDVFMPYLTDNDQIIPSVHFLGTMGIEKNKVYKKTAVGVMNPSGRTETFGLGAVEMGAWHVPVVSKGTNGLLDTIIHGETGLLTKSDNDLSKYIIRLLKDQEENKKLGDNNYNHVRSSFSPTVIISQWVALFHDVYGGTSAVYIRPCSHFGNNMKWIRMVIRFLRMRLHLKFLPAWITVESKVRSMVRR